MVSWSDAREKIKEAYNKIETAYNEIETGAGKVKEHRILNTAVRIALPNIPIVGQYLLNWYDNAGGEEEDKTKQILQFLKNLQQQSEEQFKRISEDLKVNLDAIISSNIEITQLISKRSTEILDEVHKVRQDTTVIRQDVKEVKEILKTHQATIQQITYTKKPVTFHGEKPIFIGRQNYIDKIKEYFKISNYPVSLIGIGGMGKSALAFKAIHQCEEMFDLIIPIYFAELGVSLDSFVSSIAKSLNIDEAEFDKLDLEGRKQFLIDTLGRSKNTHPLLFLDNYETISGVLKEHGSSSSSSSSSRYYNDAVQINSLLKRVPSNTSLILTSRLRKNLDREREILLDSLSVGDGRELFIELAGADLENPSEEKVQLAIEKLVQKIGGHPLSIEILARSYQGLGIEEIEGKMLKNLGLGEVNPEEEYERLRTLEACFQYSINNLDETLKQLLPKLTLFKSPFPITAASEIFKTDKANIINLYNRSLLTRIESDEIYGKMGDQEYLLYDIHPALRNYLQNMSDKSGLNLEFEYGEKYSNYYYNLLYGTYYAIGKKKDEHLQSLARFNIIFQGETNDFDRAAEISKNKSLKAEILQALSQILPQLGILSKSLQYVKRSLEIHRELNDIVGLAGNYKNIGVVLRKIGRLQEALDSHNKALEIDKQLNDIVELAKDYANIGLVLWNMGRLQEALDSHNKALEIGKQLNDIVGLAKDYKNIGVVLAEMGRLQEALDSHNKALEIDKQLNDIVGLTGDYYNISLVLSKTSKKEEALKSLYNALIILQEFEKQNNYHHPLIEQVNNRISYLKGEGG